MGAVQAQAVAAAAMNAVAVSPRPARHQLRRGGYSRRSPHVARSSCIWHLQESQDSSGKYLLADRCGQHLLRALALRDTRGVRRGFVAIVAGLDGGSDERMVERVGGFRVAASTLCMTASTGVTSFGGGVEAGPSKSWRRRGRWSDPRRRWRTTGSGACSMSWPVTSVQAPTAMGAHRRNDNEDDDDEDDPHFAHGMVAEATVA